MPEPRHINPYSAYTPDGNAAVFTMTTTVVNAPPLLHDLATFYELKWLKKRGRKMNRRKRRALARYKAATSGKKGKKKTFSWDHYAEAERRMIAEILY